ncbi:fimbrial protein [Pseudomonas fragi]|uniref:fimbrial protein n=1 Tax=Pseudomonas fragi TaxID=296 RepID=UPI000B4CCA3B|nr:fimbrial protein [Pseudomonas fragi]ASC85888.1 exotoxin [Pseudomonas fragi]
MIKPFRARLAIACGAALLPLCEGVMAQVTVSIRGVIVAPPPCVINAGSTLNVPFGDDLMTTRIDGVNYRRGVPYTLTCGPQPSNNMKITLQGTGAGFGSAYLGTSKSDLGIKLLLNGAAWPLNNAVNFTYPTLPVIEAVPVKNPGSTLTGGAFSASATLVVALQ